MAKKRFSSQELYSLRNDIPIERVIKDALDIPWRDTEGCFRFLCPFCNGFNTAVNPVTNLARCFSCEKNFNAIDLVMLIKESDFVDSIRFLKKYQQNNMNPNPSAGPGLKVGTNGFAHIGNVLESVMVSKEPFVPSTDENLSNRVLALEHKLDLLVQRVEKLAKSLP